MYTKRIGINSETAAILEMGNTRNNKRAKRNIGMTNIRKLVICIPNVDK